MMENYTDHLYEQLDERLIRLETQTKNVLEQFQLSVEAIQDILLKLRKNVIQRSFKDQQEEIQFFKCIMPKFYAKLIYYLRVFHIESCFPVASDSLELELLHTELKRIKYFFQQNMEFYRYHVSGAEHLDQWLYTRGQHNLYLIHDEYYLLIDPEFSTVHSYKLAKFLAYPQIKKYLDHRMAHLKSESQFLAGDPPRLQWTASKTDLIELLYALQSTGTFNHSQADIKKIAAVMEAVFDVQLGNFYRVFQEIRIRKKNRTSFLDHLKETLIRRMDATDEDGMRK